MPGIKIDKIIRSKRRSIALVVMHDASLVIRAPLGVSIDYIQRFVTQKSSWIEKKQRHISEIIRKSTPKNYSDGEIFRLTGFEYILKVSNGKKLYIWLEGKTLNMSDACLVNPIKYLTQWYIIQAKSIIPGRVKMYSALFGLKYKSVRINRAKTRWGSCGPKNTLNFSWKLVIAPFEIIDYVIVHELVHTEIKNHSNKFYSRLGELIPDYKNREKWFKSNINFAEL